MYKYNEEELYNETIEKLKEIGVELKDIANIVLEIQKPYAPNLTHEKCLESVKAVLHKREAIHAIITGLTLDELCSKKQLPEPLQTIIYNDEGLYGIDEILPLGIINIYGSIGLTNFGYLDKIKPSVIGMLDNRKKEDGVATFADDLVSAIAAAAASRVAHANEK